MYNWIDEREWTSIPFIPKEILGTLTKGMLTMTNEHKIRPMDQAAESILFYLMNEGLKPHDKLLSEREMAEQWKLNRTTLRSALNKLEKQGKIYSKPGVGNFVAEKKILRNVQDNYSTTQAVASSGNLVTSKILSTKIVEANKKLSQKLHLMLGHKIYVLERLRYANGVPFMIESSYIDYEIFRRIEDWDFEKQSLYEAFQSIGREIIEGTETIEVAEAREDEVELLEMENFRTVFLQKGVARDEMKRPAEYFTAVLRGDITAFSSLLT